MRKSKKRQKEIQRAAALKSRRTRLERQAFLERKTKSTRKRWYLLFVEYSAKRKHLKIDLLLRFKDKRIAIERSLLSVWSRAYVMSQSLKKHDWIQNQILNQVENSSTEHLRSMTAVQKGYTKGPDALLVRAIHRTKIK